MPDDSAPKSAYELAMERLKKKDKEEGVEEHALTKAQRDAIAEARKVAEARLAEAEILHASKMRGALEPEAQETAEQEYRRDRDRVITDRDRKIEEIRRGKA